MIKRIGVALLVVAVAGLLLVTAPSGGILGSATAAPHEVVITMGEFFFQGPEGQSGAFNQPLVNVATISGASDGTIELIIDNTAADILHEILSPLFGATEEVTVELLDSAGNVIAEVESTDLLELELAKGQKAKIELVLAESIVKSLKADPNLTMVFEISCHVEGHYEAGMRATITLTP